VQEKWLNKCVVDIIVFFINIVMNNNGRKYYLADLIFIVSKCKENVFVINI